MKRYPKLLVALALAAALAMPTWLGLRRALLDHCADPASHQSITVVVPKGAGLRQTARILARAGVVDHPGLFVLAARLTGRQSRIQAGEYALSPAMSYRRLLHILSTGRVVLHTVLIPEGFTLRQIIDRLASAGLVDRGRALALAHDRAFLDRLGLREAASLEGYLFPATYRLPRGLDTAAVLARMVRRFLRQWEEIAPQARARGMTRHQVVTLASIIEREARLDRERPLISAVYHNRLKKGMPLQADPTVIYGLEHFDGNLRRVHLATDTPYNTYTRTGLPPGPICSPGLASLRAAVNPAPVDYLYFVARGDGSHHFSRTYRQHRRAVNRYQRRR